MYPEVKQLFFRSLRLLDLHLCSLSNSAYQGFNTNPCTFPIMPHTSSHSQASCMCRASLRCAGGSELLDGCFSCTSFHILGGSTYGPSLWVLFWLPGGPQPSTNHRLGLQPQWDPQSPQYSFWWAEVRSWHTSDQLILCLHCWVL